jgi:hypothetical protein
MPSGGFNVCEPCSECVVAGNSFNGNCPNKCIPEATTTTASTTVRECIAHRECDDTQYCTDSRQCAPCYGCIDGATWNVKVCPNKCVDVLGPQLGQTVGSNAKSDASADKFSAALAAGITLCAVVLMGAAAYVVTTRQRRRVAGSAAVVPAMTLSTSNARFDSVAAVHVDHARDSTVDLEWDDSLTLVGNTSPALKVATIRTTFTSETTV